ncbi:hypothetical protein F4803DRAFT_556558 [Xylaria telfairii]|nr:hypothetical protein F4803DRAFT_556558 [Xylaria telfairii]
MSSRRIVHDWVDSVSVPPGRIKTVSLPRSAAVPTTRACSRSRSESPTTRTKIGLRSRGDLSRLEKPASIVGLKTGAAAANTISNDIRALYEDVRAAAQLKQRIIPYEVRDQILALEDDIPDATFREPNVDAALTPGPVPVPSDAHDTLLDVIYARTIILAWRGSPPSWTPPSSAPPSPSYSHRNETSRISRAQSHSTARTGGPIQRALISLKSMLPSSTAAAGEGLGYGVNQTLLTDLLYVPIAVSIETKIASSQADPLVQLSLWTAAWHKRMYALRHHLFPLPPQSYLPPGSRRMHPRLVSVPVIEVVSHEWFIYFTCYRGQSINVYGPLRLGSTTSTLEICTLVASLECVKRWIKTTFLKGIENWFMRE